MSEGQTIEQLQERVQDLERQVKVLEGMLGKVPNHAYAQRFLLPEKLSEALSMLATMPVIKTGMFEKLGIATDTKVAIHRLRTTMAPFGIAIASRRGIGYWMEEEDKAKLQSLLVS